MLPEDWRWECLAYGKAVNGEVPMHWTAAHDSGRATVWPDRIWTDEIRGAEIVGLVVTAVSLEQRPVTIEARNAVRARLHHVAYVVERLSVAVGALEHSERNRDLLLDRIDDLKARMT